MFTTISVVNLKTKPLVFVDPIPSWFLTLEKLCDTECVGFDNV
jgi:hypothetical protein